MLILLNGGARRSRSSRSRRSPRPITASRWSPICCASRRCSIWPRRSSRCPYALLAAQMDFRKQAQGQSGLLARGAAAALGGALAGLGVWTLVLAPIVLFGTPRDRHDAGGADRWIWPSFDFRGAGGHRALRRGDGGRRSSSGSCRARPISSSPGAASRPHELGIYTDQPVPHADLRRPSSCRRSTRSPSPPMRGSSTIRRRSRAAFARAARIIMVAAMPFYLGLAVTAEPLVLTVLGAEMGEPPRRSCICSRSPCRS